MSQSDTFLWNKIPLYSHSRFYTQPFSFYRWMCEGSLHYHKPCSWVCLMCGYCRSQHIQRAVVEPLQGKGTGVVTEDTLSPLFTLWGFHPEFSCCFHAHALNTICLWVEVSPLWGDILNALPCAGAAPFSLTFPWSSGFSWFSCADSMLFFNFHDYVVNYFNKHTMPTMETNYVCLHLCVCMVHLCACINMYLSIHVCVHEYINYVCILVCAFECAYAYLYELCVHMHEGKCTFRHVCVSMFVCLCVFICIFAFLHVLVCVCAVCI
jgi:hypothetical protein